MASVLLLTMAALFAVTRGCDDFMYNGTVDAAMSGRALDQGYSWDVTFQFVPTGAHLEGLPTNASMTLLPYTAKYGFALSSGMQAAFIGNPNYNFTTPPLGGGIDGLNSMGLSAAVLFDPNGNETFATNNGSGVVVSILDWVAYSLATFASVEEARVALSSGAVTLSEAYARAPQFQSSFANPYHSVLRDATHDQMVVEYTKEGELKVYNERSLVLCNGPSFPTHLAQLAEWLGSKNNGQRPTYLTAPQTGSFWQNLTFSPDNQTATTQAPSKWWGFPGDYSSTSRFIKLSMLNMIAQTSTQYPNNATWSPSAYPGPYPFKALFDATEGFLGTVLLPLGVDDKGGVDQPDIAVTDYWQFVAIRDHINKYFWYKTPSSPAWKLIDVGGLSAKNLAFKGYSLPSNYGANRTWYEDVSYVATASPEDMEEAQLDENAYVSFLG